MIAGSKRFEMDSLVSIMYLVILALDPLVRAMNARHEIHSRRVCWSDSSEVCDWAFAGGTRGYCIVREDMIYDGIDKGDLRLQ